MSSQQFSKSERYLARMASNFPWLKNKLKIAYQTINYVLFKKDYPFKSIYELETIDSKGETFFGYYDKSPISSDNRYIIFHESNYSTSKIPDANKPISVCLYDLTIKEVIYKKSVNSYNWQQGARLQWLTNNQFIFNNHDDTNGYHSTIVEIDKNREINERIITVPIYDCFNETFALTLNFERLNELRPDYGYRNHDVNSPLNGYEVDGVFEVNLALNNCKLLISLERIINVESSIEISKAQKHKVNHIMISPKGTQFIFLHRYFIGDKRYDRLMLYDFPTDSIKILASHDMVSHCCWMDENTIVGYLRDFEQGDEYYQIDTRTCKRHKLGNGIIDKFGDGHPSVLNNELLFDTYPNKARMKTLFVYNLDTNHLEELGEFYESLKYNLQTRCDLHPRFSKDGQRIFFDSVHTGRRQLFWLNRH